MVHNVVISCLICLTLVAAFAAAIGNENAEQNFDVAAYIKAVLNGESEPIKVFDDQTPGFDSRDDKFYYQDNLVSGLYKREKFKRGLITLAGQVPDTVGTQAQHSTYPFGVGQQTTTLLGTLSERWDSKDLGKDGAQLFAIYHGHGNPLVVNKVRAHLLRSLANNIQESLPLLTNMWKKSEDVRNLLENVVSGIFEHVFADVDQIVRVQMNDNDDSWAIATVVLVTESTIVTAQVGSGQVLGYDSAGVIQQLTASNDDVTNSRVFGAKKSRAHWVESVSPNVEIYERASTDVQFLVLESPLVVQSIDNANLIRIVKSEITQHKHNEAQEQQIYSSSVSRILEASSKQGNMMTRLFNVADHTVMLVGLERDYKNIY